MWMEQNGTVCVGGEINIIFKVKEACIHAYVGVTYRLFYCLGKAM